MLTHETPLVFSRALMRTVRRLISGEILYGDNRESFRASFLHPDGIPWWVIRTHRRRRREYPAKLAELHHGHLVVFRLKTTGQTECLLAQEAEINSDRRERARGNVRRSLVHPIVFNMSPTTVAG